MAVKKVHIAAEGFVEKVEDAAARVVGGHGGEGGGEVGEEGEDHWFNPNSFPPPLFESKFPSSKSKCRECLLAAAQVQPEGCVAISQNTAGNQARGTSESESSITISPRRMMARKR
jgi:hypothetical protein